MIMTRYADRGTVEREVPVDRRGEPVLDDQAAAELTKLGTEVETHVGAPQDIEWVRSSGEFHIVQSRPITALPPAEAGPPTEWDVPDRTAMYVRASIVEQLPDPLTPLFADLIDSSVTRSLQALFTELIGESVIDDSDVDLPTINGYAYYRYSRAGMVRLMLHMGGAAKFLLGGGEQGGVGRWRTYAHPRYRASVDRWQARDLDQLSITELLDGIVELLDAGTEYYTAVQTIIPIAATSEVLFTQFYDRLVRRPGDPAAPTFLLGFDSLPIKAEKSLYDIGTWARSVPGLADRLLATPTQRLVAALHDHAALDDHPALAEWRERFSAHLAAYGHTVYNLDFANAVPADDPAPLIETLRFYLRGEGSDPYQRQREAAERRERQTAAVLDRLDPVRRKRFLRLLRWAQRAAPIREDALGDVGLAWPQMRRMLTELGQRLVAGGALTDPEQVYWLRRDEVVQAGAAVEQAAGPPAELASAIAERQEVWRGRRRVTPPQLLPEQGWMRIFGSMMPATTAEQGEDRLTGIGASAGRVTAAARVLGGPEDFGQMRAGDVLVASITTPAWTPLFALASGVVTDIGGPLSHSSIVAREYGIPAVLGTGVATRRISNDQAITVDGDAGTVGLTPLDDQAEVAPAADRPGKIKTAAGAAGGVALGIAIVAILRRRRRRRASM
jgi:pyruvate,water dikinase